MSQYTYSEVQPTVNTFRREEPDKLFFPGLSNFGGSRSATDFAATLADFAATSHS